MFIFSVSSLALPHWASLSTSLSFFLAFVNVRYLPLTSQLKGAILTNYPNTIFLRPSICLFYKKLVMSLWSKTNEPVLDTSPTLYNHFCVRQLLYDSSKEFLQFFAPATSNSLTRRYKSSFSFSDIVL